MLTPFSCRRPLPGPGSRAALPLSHGLRGAALRAPPGRLRRPRLCQRRHVRGGRRRRAALLVRAGLRRARLSGTRRPLCLSPLCARRSLLRPLLRPRLRLRARLHGREMRVLSAPRRCGRSARGPAGPEAGRPTTLPSASRLGAAGGCGLGRRRAFACPRASPKPCPGSGDSLAVWDPGAFRPHAAGCTQQSEDTRWCRGRPQVRAAHLVTVATLIVLTP